LRQAAQTLKTSTQDSTYDWRELISDAIDAALEQGHHRIDGAVWPRRHQSARGALSMVTSLALRDRIFRENLSDPRQRLLGRRLMSMLRLSASKVPTTLPAEHPSRIESKSISG
jgi:hypothetical protein